MREILFRGKRKDNGEWIEGLLWKKKYNTNKLFISCFPDKDDNEEVFVICPETVGQYTGLTDKNGTKIFEGDIVKIENRKYTISFEKGCWVILGKSEFWDFLQTNTKRCEVIGNIHDNPELLGGGE